MVKTSQTSPTATRNRLCLAPVAPRRPRFIDFLGGVGPEAPDPAKTLVPAGVSSEIIHKHIVLAIGNRGSIVKHSAL